MKHILKLIILGISLIVLNSCYYRPFITYTLNKRDFKHFSKREKIAGNNANPQRDYHINKYDWNVKVFPEKRKISGKMIIYFTPNSEQNTFLFDLQNKMKINSFTCSVKNLKIKRNRDLMYLVFENNVPKNTRISLVINYEGKPANVFGQGPIIWKFDKHKRPWISTSTEGIGPQFIMPCNALLNAEADSCNINITIPKDLIAVANGKLKKVINNNNSTKTYNYSITNPINIYNISFNIGHFKKIIKPYKDINGVEREIECQVLDYNYDIANKFYDQVPIIMHEFEKMFGEFPWWNDGCKFIESNFTAMEHQSGIAMGNDYATYGDAYNITLVHELAHEWWGNNITGKDYCDIWIHEGFATYAEALFSEKLSGKKLYEKHIAHDIKSIKNTIPLYKKCDVLYNSWTNSADQDIYKKGSLLVHSLRMVVNNDSLFFNSLHTIQKDFKQQNVSTKEIINKFNKLLENDYSELFDWYLNRTEPPILQVVIDKEKGELHYKWKEEILFFKHGKITLQNHENLITLMPTLNYQTYRVKDVQINNFLIEKSIYYKVKVLKRKTI